MPEPEPEWRPSFGMLIRHEARLIDKLLPWSAWRMKRSMGPRRSARLILKQPFPLYGVAQWDGEQTVAGTGESLLDGKMVLSSVDLMHAAGERWVSVRTHMGGEPTGIELDEERQELGTVSVRMDDANVTLRAFSTSDWGDADWAAVGDHGGVRIAIEARGVTPDALHLIPVDPRPYIKGSRAVARRMRQQASRGNHNLP